MSNMKPAHEILTNNFVSAPKDGDDSITVADLARNTLVDVSTYCHFSDVCHAIRDAYQDAEVTEFTLDYYDGFFIEFADGSILSYYA